MDLAAYLVVRFPERRHIGERMVSACLSFDIPIIYSFSRTGKRARERINRQDRYYDTRPDDCKVPLSGTGALLRQLCNKCNRFNSGYDRVPVLVLHQSKPGSHWASDQVRFPATMDRCS